MPLIYIKEVMPEVSLGLWKIEESVDAFLSLYPELTAFRDEIEAYGSVQRRLEVLAVRALLSRMTAHGVKLYHDKSGRPLLSDGTNIGISHTHGCAAVVISMRKKVAVDVEYFSKRVERIAGRLLRNDEKADTLEDKLLHWCTKETMYKLYPEDNLSLNEMQLLSINRGECNGIITARNIKRGETLCVHYRSSDGIVLTYAAL